MRMTNIALLLALALCFAATAKAQAFWRAPNAHSSWYTVTPETKRVWKKHDLVLIRISEKRSATRNDRFSGSREAKVDAAISAWPRLGKLPTTITPSTAEEIDLTGDSKLESDAEGRRDRRSAYSDVIMAEVTEVMPGYDPEMNQGNLMIRAYKSIKLGDDVERVELTGRIEAKHINMDDSISADRVFGAEIKYDGKGDVSDMASQGWLTSIFSALWPF